MFRIALILLLAFGAGVARAGDKLAFGPPADWVRVAAEPKVGVLPETGPAVRLLRYDQQLQFSADTESIYVDRIAQARTAQGLPGLGTLTFTWDPGRDTVTVHRVRILRGGVSIDLLAKQTFTILRREANLAQIVDGRLTATLQPEDLRVGDLLEVAYTTTHADPVLKGRADFIFNLGALKGQESSSLRAVWSQPVAVTWRTGKGLPEPKLLHRGPISELSIDLANLPETNGPAGAPARYQPTREIEFSGFKSWEEIGAQLSPLFERAATLSADSPLKAEAAKIRAASADPKVRAAAALKLVQDQVRYLGLVLQDGGYTPVDADVTWTRRFGECKAKSVLLVALLRELGIKAEPVVANAYGDALLNTRLPRLSAFNHAIVRAEIGGKVYWLDGTRTGDENLDAIDVPAFDWALPIRPRGSQLVALVRAPRDKPDVEIALDVDASSGIEAAAPVKGEMVMRGTTALFPQILSANLPPKEREEMFKAMWARFPWIEVKSSSLSRDGASGETRIAMQGTAKLRWFASTTGQTLFVPEANLGYRADFKRDPGPDADAPFQVGGYPAASTYRLAIKLPDHGAGFTAPAPDVDKTVAGRAFKRTTTLKDGVLSIETRTGTVAPEFPASEAKAASAVLNEMASVRVSLNAPATYRATPGDIAAWQAQDPKTAQDLYARGRKFGGAGRFPEAIADFEKAMELDPRSSSAYSGRGAVRLSQNDLPRAREDYEKAVSLDDRNAEAHFGLGALALRAGRPADAVAELTRAIYLRPPTSRMLSLRAEAYRKTAELDRALSDADEAVRVDPKDLSARYERMQIYVGRHDDTRALAEADVMVATAPDNPLVHVYRGVVLSRLERRAEADAAFAASIKIKPTIYAYLTWAAQRPKSDVAARLADIDAAEKLDPKNAEISLARAGAYADAERWSDAIQILNRAAGAQPIPQGVIEMRARIHARAGNSALASKDFAAWRLKVGADANQLNALCWSEATVGFDLSGALADCDAALKASPKEAAFLDSRGLVLLRLGRFQDAIDAYNAAIETRPRQAQSLYGRGLAKLRLNRREEGEADLAAARTEFAKVDEEFAGYGLRPTSALHKP